MAREESYTATFLGNARRKAGLTQKEASEKTGIPLGTIRRWEQGQNDPDMGSLIQLAELYSVSLDEILGMDSFRSNGFKYASRAEMASVPLLGSIAAGTPIEMINIDETYDIPADIHDRYPQAFLLKVVGDSMNRVLPNGCYALINPCQEASKPMKAYAVCVNGYDATIKRIKQLENGVELIPDSKDPTFHAQVYDKTVEGTESITVIGEVVWYSIPFDFKI